MATRVYFLKTTNAAVTLNVRPTVIGIVSTVVQLKKSGGSIIDLGNSGNNATGTITNLPVGKSNDLLNAALVITTVVNLVNVPKAQWDSVFESLRITYQLNGGIDGLQTFNVDNDDKMQIMKKQIIVATKAIKFTTNEIA
jgi:hypothetical protein